MTKLLTTEQTAELLGISVSSFRKQLRTRPQALPPYVVVGKVKRWRPSDVDEWINNNLSA